MGHGVTQDTGGLRPEFLPGDKKSQTPEGTPNKGEGAGLPETKGGSKTPQRGVFEKPGLDGPRKKKKNSPTGGPQGESIKAAKRSEDFERPRRSQRETLNVY